VAWAWLATALAKIGKFLIRPKDQKALKDESSRQTNVFSKVENTYIIQNPRTNEFYVGNYPVIPKEILEAIAKQFDPQKHEAGEQPEFRLVRNDFHDDIDDFQAHLEKDDELLRRIAPYIAPQYESIFRLASYAKSRYEQDERERGDEIRNQVGLQYGRAGRKLCNLYLKGYVSDMFQHYLEPILASVRERSEISVRLNELIRSLVRFSEHVYFIHPGSRVGVVAAAVKIAVERGVPYIALHSAGVRNVGKTYKIVEVVGLDFLEKNDYAIRQQPTTTAPIPFFDVFITKRLPDPAQQADNYPRPGSGNPIQ